MSSTHRPRPHGISTAGCPRRRGKLVLALAVVPLLLSGCGLATTQRLPGVGEVADSPSPNARATSRGAELIRVEQVLQEHDYACYETVSKPSVVRSCYLTAPDGAQIAVRMRAAADGEAVEVTLKGRQSGTRGSTSPNPRGSVLEPSTQALIAISQVLLGAEDSKHLKAESRGVSQRVSVPWGTIHVGISTRQSFASFLKAGNKPLNGTHPLPVPRQEVVRGLRAAGFACEGDFSLDCDKDVDDVSVNVSVRKNMIVLAVWGDSPLTNATLGVHTEALLRQVARGAARDAVTSWARARLSPDFGAVQGDVGGLHIEITRDESVTGRDAAEVVIQDARSAV